MTSIFFYGLFMDSTLLEDMGLHPDSHEPAKLDDYQILIGSKATLVPTPAATSYGIVMRLSEEEAAILYAQPGVSDYRAEEVEVLLTEASVYLKVDCYNLPREKVNGPANIEYASKLAELVLKKGFPPAYADKIKLSVLKTPV